MTTRMRATYERGTLRLTEAMPLADGTAVDVIVVTDEPTDTPHPSPAEIIARIAALPLEPGSDGFSGADHDRVLYGQDASR